MKVPESKLLREAKRRFHVTTFRLGQRELIDAVLTGRDAIGVLPTGAGKSLTFQLPAVFLPKLTVVVSPLIALMQDQTAKLEAAQVEVARLDSSVSAAERKDAEERIANGAARIVVVTPERLGDPDTQQLLSTAGVSLLVVDEAHCIAQWGHDFRPAYLGLKDAAKALGRPTILALTATAPANVLTDITAQLGLKSPRLVSGSIARENLFLNVTHTPSEDDKRRVLLERLRQAEGASIVYTATVKACDELHAWLSANGLTPMRYHGRMPAKQRKETLDFFMMDPHALVIATNAFGLGIDKTDLREVFHYHFPDTLETYYQEAGRAGRDGGASRATLLYRIEDRRIQSYFLGGKYPRRDQSFAVYKALAGGSVTVKDVMATTELPEKRVRVVLAQLASADIVTAKRGQYVKHRDFGSLEELETFLAAYEARHESDKDRLRAMMDYAESGRCRWQTLANYFGEAEVAVCMHCDNCSVRYSDERKAG